MPGLNMIFLFTSCLTYFKPTIPNINIKMTSNDDMFNTDDVLGLKLFKAYDTKDLTIRWLHRTLDETTQSKTFVIDDLVNMLSYSIKEPEKYNLFIAYMPNNYEEQPEFIGYFSIQPDKKILSLLQICTNPFNKNTSLTNYKKKLINLATNSNVRLSIQPLKYIKNPRYYLEFTQSF